MAFLREKLRGRSAWDLFVAQVEDIALWLVGGLPGLPGFAARNAVYKLFCKDLRGFAWVQPGVAFSHLRNLTIGRHFGCNAGSFIGSAGGITIGDYVLIGSNVTISSAAHPIDGDKPVFARPVVPNPVTIEDDVWIAAGAVVLPGVTLKRGTVVGANAVVTTSTTEYGVYVGAPARMVRSRIRPAP